MSDRDTDLRVPRPELDFDDARAKAAVAQRLFGVNADTRVDRFPLGTRLGAGTYGVVYDAYDPRLDRRVALKVVRLDAQRDHDADAALLGEARAAARLEHPAVVSVFDAGVDGDVLWIAMEQVPGGSLRTFFEDASPTWPELVEVFAQVAEGLHAAHQVGLLHRDLKPDNVLVEPGPPPRARIVDFGLAADIEPVEADPSISLATLETASAGRTTRQRAGTPAYMAPEQLDAEPLGPAADQFAFFVSLYEALHGHRPFAGATMHALREAIVAGVLRPGTRGLPRWLVALMRRGMAPEPTERWPDMGVVAQRLRQGLVRRARRPWIFGVGVLALAAGAGSGLVLGSKDPCSNAADRIEPLAAESARAELAAKLHAVAPARDTDYASRSLDAVDAWVSQWRSGRVQACEAGHAGALTRSQAEVRIACYDDRLSAFEGLRDRALRLPDGSAAAGVALGEALGRLPSIEDCDDTLALRRRESWVQAGPDDAQARAAVREALHRVSGALTLPPDADTIAALDEATAKADALGYRPLQALAAFLGGGRAQHEGDYETAIEHARRALRYAVAGQDDIGAADAALHLMWVYGELLRDPAAASEFAGLADAYVEALGDPPPARARWLDQQGVLDLAAGDVATARRRFEAALALRENEPSLSGTLHRTLFNLADAYPDDPSKALALTERALVDLRETVGPAHPNVALALSNQGVFLDRLERDDEARRVFREALALKEDVYGPNHPALASTLNNLGHLVPPAEAAALYRRALSVLEPVVGADSPRLASALFNLGTALRDLGDHEEARTFYERNLAVLVDAYGEAHPRVFAARVAIAGQQRALGEADVARDRLEALARAVPKDADPYDRAELWTRLAEARADTGDAEGSVAADAKARAACVGEPEDCLPKKIGRTDARADPGREP